MNSITVPIKGENVTLTLIEADKLLNTLQTMLVRFRDREAMDELMSPVLTENGYITRMAMDAFFAQIYPDNPAELANHSSKLFNRVAAAAYSGGSGINVVCRDCSKLIHEQRFCPVLERSHLVLTRNLMVEAVSLKEKAELFISTGYRNVGTAIINDLRILCEYL